MLVVTRANNQGVIVKYTSTDLSKWEDGGVFFENDMGTDSNMECPILLEFNGKWYLSFSDQWPNRQVHYRIADRVDGLFEKLEQDIFDSDGFYAGRMETDGENLYVVGWNGTLTPVSNPDVEEAMSEEITLVPEKMTETVEKSVGRLNLVFNPAENKIEFHNSSNVMEDDAQSVVDYDFSSGDPIEIKMYISNGVVTMYVNDQVAMTARMYMSQGMEWGMFSAKSKVTFTDTEKENCKAQKNLLEKGWPTELDGEKYYEPGGCHNLYVQRTGNPWKICGRYQRGFRRSFCFAVKTQR